MKAYDVVVKTAIGELLATLDAEDHIPTGLILQAVMSHQQTYPHLTALGANHAEVLMVTSIRRLQLPPGLTVVFHDGVNINGPIKPSPIPNVPKAFAGVTLTHNLAVVITYRVDPHAEPGEDIECDDDGYAPGFPY